MVWEGVGKSGVDRGGVAWGKADRDSAGQWGTVRCRSGQGGVGWVSAGRGDEVWDSVVRCEKGWGGAG